MSWAAKTYPSSITSGGEDVKFVLWGQSLGAAVAVDAAATAMSSLNGYCGREAMRIDGLLLETPFVSVKAMLLALYPQKWLPYRYLWPFLLNHWDTREALKRLADSCEDNQISANLEDSTRIRILILQAEKDELVPASQSLELEAYAREVGSDVKRIEVRGALHNEVSMKAAGREAIVGFLRAVGDVDRDRNRS